MRVRHESKYIESLDNLIRRRENGPPDNPTELAMLRSERALALATLERMAGDAR